MSMKSLILAIFSLMLPSLVVGQTVTSFEGMDASQLNGPGYDVDPNGAVGTKQYLEWVNTSYQAFNKTTHAAVWPTPQNGDTPWQDNNMSNCYGAGGGDGIVSFDRLASRWVIARRASSQGQYYYCVAVSNTDDLASTSLAWFTYGFALNSVLGSNSQGHVYWPDWPRFGAWSDGYYVSFNLQDTDNAFQNIGVVACAMDRTNMIIGATARNMQCFSDPSPIPLNGALYLAHSLIPADFDGATAPPSGRHEYFLSIQNPPNDGVTTTSTKLNLWNFHVDWKTPTNSTFKKTQLSVGSYTPGCYELSEPELTNCVNQPSSRTTGWFLDSVGDRLMPRMTYRNFGTYQSFLISFTVQVTAGTNQQTGIRWYELRGSGNPTIFQSATVTNGTQVYRFLPSIAQDKVGNAAVGYSVSGNNTHPGIRASYWSLPSKTKATEINVKTGIGDEENTGRYGDYTSMTVDPVDDCTFWYVNQYFAADQIGTLVNWDTKVAHFKLSTCQ
jgi:hypothetical protein